MLHGFSGQGDNYAHFAKTNVLSKNARVVCPSGAMFQVKDFTGVMKTICKNFHPGKKEVHSWTDQGHPVESIKGTIQRIWAIIDAEALKLNGDTKKIFICGHSQGANVALQTALGYSKPLGGMVAMMNFAVKCEFGRHQANVATPIFAIFGKKDDICKIDNLQKQANHEISQKGNRLTVEVWEKQGHLYDVPVITRVNEWTLSKFC